MPFRPSASPRLLVAALAFALTAAAHAGDYQDHYEFDAALSAPYRADKNLQRDFGLDFRFPGADDGTRVVWRLDIVDANARIVRQWRGESLLAQGAAQEMINWSERDARNGALPWGHYEARLSAVALDPSTQASLAYTPVNQRVDAALRDFALDVHVQSQDIEIGRPAYPAMPAFNALRTSKTANAGGNTAYSSAPATGGLPYTVYFANLHSQTNHSDGGGDVSTCTDASNPQAGAFGPSDAYTYARGKGLDILATTEHNHLFDGSTGTNASANPATAKNLYQSGLTAASSFNASHSGFLAVYGMEWGVINNGGHLNIFNANELLSWEYNSSNQLIGDTFVAKNDYASLYTLMKQRGWIGQFNHPDSSGQFLVGTTSLGYTADGDAVMVLAEVSNTSAFSHNTTETETSRSSYQGAYDLMLERGFHVAPATNQDNHCANWGASLGNRTAVLIPNGTALSMTSFLDALRARRVFATHDKTSQLILTANGHVMGERFANSGSLTLTANYAPGAGRSASTVKIYTGVPGSNGTVATLASTATATTTPSTGEHFYYAKITQDDGTLMWSAPIWVTQGTGGGGGDTTAPTVSASESGTSGTITLSATASDASGVSKVEFYVDGALKATDTASPYSATLDSTTLSNASHSLVAKAYDPSNNVGTSSAVSFTVSNGTGGGTTFTEAESNGTVATANAVAHSYTAIKGTMGNTTDKDYFALSLAANEKVTLSLTSPTSTDYDMYLVDSAGTTLASSTSSASPETLTYTNGAAAKTVYAQVFSYSGSSTTNQYNLAVAYTAGTGGGAATELLGNTGFESGNTVWTATTSVVTNDTSQAGHAGSWYAWLDGYGAAHTDSAYQQVTIPAAATSATLTFWLKVVSAETTTTQAYDTLKVQVRNGSGTVLATLATYSNLDKGASYVQKTFDLSAYKGQTVQVYFLGVEGSTTATSFLLDDVSLKSQ